MCSGLLGMCVKTGFPSGFCAICSCASSNLSLHCGVLGWLSVIWGERVSEGLFIRDSSSWESHPARTSCSCEFLYSNCIVPLSTGFVLWPLAVSPTGPGSRLPHVSQHQRWLFSGGHAQGPAAAGVASVWEPPQIGGRT